MMKMGDVAIDIPPGRSDYAIADRYVLPVDVKVLSLYPHAHYLGREMEVRATPPGGTARTLLHIKRWSFHWQQDYRYVSPVTLPRGTTIDMRFTYDNSDGNADNPHHPPVRVTSGPRSTDEMGNLLLQIVPASAEDRRRLLDDLAARDRTRNVAIAEARVQSAASAENLTFLGSSYVDAGRVADGIAALERALALDSGSARALNELGGALLKAGRTQDAVRHFKRAAGVSPDDPYLQFNLGKALAAAGSGSDAVRAFQRALALNPDFADAHDELGVLLFAAGRLDEAIAHLRKAVDLAPESAVAHSDLGGALAQAGRRDEALQHIRRALALDPGNTAAQENLARLTRGRQP